MRRSSSFVTDAGFSAHSFPPASRNESIACFAVRAKLLRRFRSSERRVFSRGDSFSSGAISGVVMAVSTTA